MSGEKRGAGRPRKPKVRTKGQDDQAVNPTIHVRVSAWTRDALHQLVKDGTYRAMGQAVDDIVKTHVMTDRPTNIVTLPRTSDDIEAYYPMLANTPISETRKFFTRSIVQPTISDTLISLSST